GSAEEALPPVLDASSDPPSLFDGSTRLYTSYICPYAQRVWIVRNYKGLQEKIKLVPINLENRPDWYKEKVYPPNKVPALEHNNEVRGESLDLIKYVDCYFEGPALYPDDPAKREFAEELLSYSDTFNRAVLTSLKEDSVNDINTVSDYLEKALYKFNNGPFFLGQISLVDIAYAPFIERFHPLLLDVKEYDITKGRPMLTSWIEEMDKIEAYKQTKIDSQELIAALKKLFLEFSSCCTI
ncbi:Glutathione transferase, partial [Bertholletia excelsa]